MNALEILKIISRKLNTTVGKLEDRALTRRHIEALRNGTAWESGYTNEIQELTSALAYRDQIEKGVYETPSESGKLYEEVIDTVSGLLQKDMAIKSVFNFGVSYAWVDSVLAKGFSKVKFVGIDRSILTKAINDAFFKMNNLSILSGDVFDELHKPSFNYKNGIFIHVRTGTLLPMSLLKSLYDRVRAVGFKYILAFEPTGLSHQTRKLYQFSEKKDKPSVVYRGFMEIHNYPFMIEKAGFKTQHELIKTDHPHPDFRIIKIVGKKIY